MRKLAGWLTNRVLMGILLFFVVIGFWEFKWKPQYRPLYERAVKSYLAHDYPDALQRMAGAYRIAPNSTDVITMMGWINLKMSRYEEARYYFSRALAIDARLEEARMGVAFVALETGRGDLSYAALRKALGRRQRDPDVRILEAGALARSGQNLRALGLYLGLAGDRSYSRAANAALTDMFGLEGFSDPVPHGLPSLSRPAQLQVLHRAAGDSMWERGRSGWEKHYLTGVDLGPAPPGYYPASAPGDGRLYTTWLRNAAQMNAEVVRVYTLLPPAFYRAFSHQVAAGARLVLYQQIWIGDPPNKDLFDPQFMEESKAEIRYVVDAIHGQGDVPPKRARASGLFVNDISAHVGAILLGREFEPSTVLRTNAINIGKSRYGGKYISVSDGNATEVWLAQMLDYLVGYETDKYNWQHPVAFVNWPPLDPLHHRTETPFYQELRMRAKRGERLAPVSETTDDDDVVSLDESKFSVGSEFQAGLFASYHVYPYYPDFLNLDPDYLKARDQQGPDPMYGYLRELRSRIPFPLLISEYGLPDSIGISHFQPYGWNHGGHNEQDQAKIVAQLTRAIHDAGCAGGFVFSLQDEWYKPNWLVRDFQNPLDRAALWLDELDPENSYGMIGYKTRNWQLFTSDAGAWRDKGALYRSVSPARPEAARQETLRSVQVSEDEGFLYLRLKLCCVDVKPGKFPLADHAYVIALNTLPSHAGVQRLPFGPLLRSGANFLLYLANPETARVLVARDYNPYRQVASDNNPAQTDVVYKRSFEPALEEKGPFEEMIVETNRRRYARDGTVYPSQRYSRSVLRYGNGDPASPNYDSLAEWYVDVKDKAILVRIPWGKLLVTDPSSRQVFAGIDKSLHVLARPSAAIEVSAFEVTPASAGQLGTAGVIASAPALAGGEISGPEHFNWTAWNDVQLVPYFKKAFYAVQQEFVAENPPPKTASGPVLRSSLRRRRRKLAANR